MGNLQRGAAAGDSEDLAQLVVRTNVLQETLNSEALPLASEPFDALRFDAPAVSMNDSCVNLLENFSRGGIWHHAPCLSEKGGTDSSVFGEAMFGEAFSRMVELVASKHQPACPVARAS